MRYTMAVAALALAIAAPAAAEELLNGGFEAPSIGSLPGNQGSYAYINGDAGFWTFGGGAGLMRLDWPQRRFEIGYWLAPDATGRGLASEAVHALAQMAFSQLKALRVEIRTDARNLPSRAVAERCGFVLEGTLRNDMLDVNAVPCHTSIYGMVALDELRHPSLGR